MELIGSGAYGKIYRVMNKAVKVSNIDFFNIYVRELMIMRYLNILNFSYCPIVHAFDVDKILFTTDLLDINLNKYMMTKHDIKERAIFLSELCKAVYVLHNIGIVHADLKLSNLMIKDKNFYIIDYGLSGSNKYALTDCTTKAYLDPTKSKDYCSDIYSLGIVFLELLSGERFEDIPCKSTINRRLSKIDKKYNLLIKKMITKNLKKRWNINRIMDFFGLDKVDLPVVDKPSNQLQVNDNLLKWIDNVIDIMNIKGPLSSKEISNLIMYITPDNKYIQFYSVALLIIYCSLYEGLLTVKLGLLFCPRNKERNIRKNILNKAITDIISNNNLILILLNNVSV